MIATFLIAALIELSSNSRDVLAAVSPAEVIAVNCSERSHGIGISVGPACKIDFSGAIRIGDAEKIRQQVLGAPSPVLQLNLESDGGNVDEALKISKVVNEFGIKVVTFRNCRSACAIVFLLSDQRSQNPFTPSVYVHRPYFEASFYEGLAREDAKAVYELAILRLLEAMRAAAVPEDIVQQMMETSSVHAAPLRRDFPERSHWFEEWMIAKCGREPTLGERAYMFRLGLKQTGIPDAGVPPEALSPSELVMREQLIEFIYEYDQCSRPVLYSEAQRLQGK